ncbi:MAG: type II toxin-antitoxin system VapC family toxin [Bifidobacteriaceae bacterium]|jgi:predicted nucleic acid-binding protein|nr:type II toxin-antitoxin system VapC family toxin [Bifidobacteriaceae bacterium]
MYLLDTNVVSELRKLAGGKCDPGVARWVGTAAPEACFISAITVKELEYGVALVERRDAAQGAALRAWLEGMLEAWQTPVLSVDAQVARRAAHLHVPDPAPEADAYLAATAMTRRLAVVTRNTVHFERFAGLEVLNPWEPA